MLLTFYEVVSDKFNTFGFSSISITRHIVALPYQCMGSHARDSPWESSPMITWVDKPYTYHDHCFNVLMVVFQATKPKDLVFF